MTYLRQSTAVEIKLGPFLDETDGKTAETGLTISQADVRLAKNAGDWAQKSETTAMAHEEAGWYRCLLDATDTDTVGTLIVAVHESGALPVWREFTVLAANVYDSLVGGGDVLDVDVAGLPASIWGLTTAGNTAPGTFGGLLADAETDTDDILALVGSINDYGSGATLGGNHQDLRDLLGDPAPHADFAGKLDAMQGSIDTTDGNVVDILDAIGTPSNLGSGATVAANLVDTHAEAAAATSQAQDAADSAGEANQILSMFVLYPGVTLVGAVDNSTTQVHLPGLNYEEGEIVDHLLVVWDLSDSESHARWVEAWAASNKIAVVGTLPFTPAENDLAAVFAIRRDVSAGGGLDAAGVRAAVGLASANLDTQLDALPTAAENADAVWDEDATAHQTQGTFGQAIGDPAADTDTIYALANTIAANIGTPSNLGGGATLSANLSDIEAQTDDIGVAGAGLTALATQASVNTIDDLLDTEIAALTTELAKVPKSDGTATWNATALAAIQSEANDAIVANRLDELLAADSDIDGAAPPTVGSVFHELMSKTAGSFTFDQTTDSNEALRDRGDAAWTTATGFSTHTAADVWSAATRTLTALGFTLGASDLAADTIGASELAADAITEIVNAVLTTAMTESYNADGAAPTLAQAMFVTLQRLTEFAISGTTITVKKLDGSTSAYTLTLDDSSNPTSSTRAT